jgi:beta-glucosidase
MTLAPAYRDAALTIDERVDDLLGRMTLEEKLAQIGSVWAFELTKDGAFDLEQARSHLSEGMGQITRVAGATNLLPGPAAELANAIQRYLVEETRLGIPAIVHEECLHGILGRGRVCFPQAIGLAATWNPGLVHDMAANMRGQLRAGGAQQALSPVFDVTRDPRWGRGEETFGEDPYLIAEMGTSYVRGLQGERGAPDSLLATGKHMAGHGMPEGGLNQAPAHIGERELRDVYLFPFEAAVRDAGLRSMMHAYHDIDGVPCVESHELFTTILRDEWGFDGIAVADYGGIDQLMSSHHVVDNRSDAAVRALEAGIDVELPSIACYGAPLAAAVEDGRISIQTIDRSVARVLREKIELGLFERPYVDADAVAADTEGDEEARAIGLQLARESIVLLENDGTLPLRGDLRSIAVIGPNADSARNLLGDYSHISHLETLMEMRDRSTVVGVEVPTSADIPYELDPEAQLAHLPTILTAIREAAGRTQVRYARGSGILDGDDAAIRDAIDAAREADVAIVVVGERSGLNLAATSGEARDRLEIGLPGRQAELVKAVAATGTPVVLVVVSGRPLGIPLEADLSAAVLYAWAPGEEGPQAVADVLFGTVNPGGKLPITVPRHVGQIPSFYGHRPSGGRSAWKGDYVDGSVRPLWPFGFGRSYTTFELSDLRLSGTAVRADGEIQIEATVANVGERDGDEVVQLYLRDPEASVSRPILELKGFRRVRLSAGQRTTVTFRLAVEQLAFTGVDRCLRIEPGRIEVHVGTSSRNLPLHASFEIEGSPVIVTDRRRYFTETTAG